MGRNWFSGEPGQKERTPPRSRSSCYTKGGGVDTNIKGSANTVHPNNELSSSASNTGVSPRTWAHQGSALGDRRGRGPPDSVGSPRPELLLPEPSTSTRLFTHLTNLGGQWTSGAGGSITQVDGKRSEAGAAPWRAQAWWLFPEGHRARCVGHLSGEMRASCPTRQTLRAGGRGAWASLDTREQIFLGRPTGGG